MEMIVVKMTIVRTRQQETPPHKSGDLFFTNIGSNVLDGIEPIIMMFSGRLKSKAFTLHQSRWWFNPTKGLVSAITRLTLSKNVEFIKRLCNFNFTHDNVLFVGRETNGGLHSLFILSHVIGKESTQHSRSTC